MVVAPRRAADAGLGSRGDAGLGGPAADAGVSFADAGLRAQPSDAGAIPFDAGLGSRSPGDAGAQAVTRPAAPSLASVAPAAAKKPTAPEVVMPTTYDDKECRTCHAAIVNKQFTHSIFKDGACSDCHLPALRSSRCDTGMSLGRKTTRSQDSKFSIAVSVVGWRFNSMEPALCTSCHEGIASDEPVHKAIEVAGCSVCHDPHSESRKKLLRAELGTLCAKCHRKDDRRYVHAPVAKGECGACHDAHTGLAQPLLKDTNQDLCIGCHKPAGLSAGKHPASAKADCSQCHVAHASDEKGLLKSKGTADIPVKAAAPPAASASYPSTPCKACHEALTNKKFKHGVFKEGGCADCHVSFEREGACKEPVGRGWALKQQEPELCTGCHDGLGKSTPMHAIIKQRGCTACHDPHSSDVKHELKKPMEQLCNGCHQRRDTGKVTHRPLLEGASCLKCHDPHSGAAAPLLKKEPGLLCIECHKEKDLMPDAMVHEPVAKGRCVECHAAHSSDKPAMLRETGQALCLRCHAAGQKGRDKAVAAKTQIEFVGAGSVHDAKGKDGCQACHVQTHTGRLDKLLKQPNVRLCLGCHDVRGKTDLHRPINEKGCSACHKPHTSENKKLLTMWPVENLCHSCHDKEQTREDLAGTHAPVQMGECLACHGAHSGEEAPLLLVQRKDLCLGCHEVADLAPLPEVHSPVKEGKCFGCHNAHGSEIPKLLVSSPTQLCMNCHDSRKAEPSMQTFARIDLSKKVVHRPLVEKDCQECHVTGHSSKVKKLLNKKPVDLCNGCHDRKDDQEHVHGAVKLGDCAVCHRPHSADQKNLAPWGREAKLCFECHEDDLSGRAVLHKPVAEGRCSKCHAPHGAPYPGNQKYGPGVQACVRCHENIKVNPKVKHTPLLRYGCTGCHDPHGAGNPAMLPKPVNEMCIKCHPTVTDGMHAATMMKGGHVVTGAFDPRRPDRAFSCASCHDPHGAENPSLFYAGADSAEMCDDCHGDRLGKAPQKKDITRKRKALPDGGVPVSFRYDAGWLGDDATAEDVMDEDELPPARARPTGTTVPVADSKPGPRGTRSE